jgi:hypothetical protein
VQNLQLIQVVAQWNRPDYFWLFAGLQEVTEAVVHSGNLPTPDSLSNEAFEKSPKLFS